MNFTLRNEIRTTNFSLSVENYSKRLMRGYSLARESKVVLCTAMRNCNERLDTFFNVFDFLKRNFKETSCVVYENDSDDGTDRTLKEWKSKNENIDLRCQRLKTGSTVEGVEPATRCKLIADARNKYLVTVEKKYSDYDYIVIVDSDMLGIFPEGLFSSLGAEEDLQWDAVTSNGIDFYQGRCIYYDIFPHMDENGEVYTSYKRLAAGELWHPGLQKPYPMFSGFVKVKSAFGGMGIYKTGSIAGARYSTYKLNNELTSIWGDKLCDTSCSEHVALHYDMINNGFDKIYINPSQMTIRGAKANLQMLEEYKKYLDESHPKND
tara:strand:- start:111 stop:1076 length:966 start_codon:yes stop_codon:yes gene_type:complete